MNITWETYLPKWCMPKTTRVIHLTDKTQNAVSPSWVMQMEPLPMPTLRASTPQSIRFLAWAAVTTVGRKARAVQRAGLDWNRIFAARLPRNSKNSKKYRTCYIKVPQSHNVPNYSPLKILQANGN